MALFRIKYMRGEQKKSILQIMSHSYLSSITNPRKVDLFFAFIMAISLLLLFTNIDFKTILGASVLLTFPLFMLDVLLTASYHLNKYVYKTLLGFALTILLFVVLSLTNLWPSLITENYPLLVLAPTTLFTTLLTAFSLFMVSHRLFGLFCKVTCNPLHPPKYRKKALQRITGLLRSVESKLQNAKNIVYLGIAVTLILSYLLWYFGFSEAEMDYSALLTINATLFALILTLSSGVLSKNEYFDYNKSYLKAIFSGWNLLFYLSYISLICLSLFTKSIYLGPLTLFMVLASLAFYINLITPQPILNIIISEIKKLIDSGDYKLGSTKAQNQFNFKQHEGMSVKIGVKFASDELERNFAKLREMTNHAYSVKNDAEFKILIRAYFELARHLMSKGTNAEKYVSNYLTPLCETYKDVDGSKEFTEICIQELIGDYRCSDSVINIKYWNLLRFQLMHCFLKHTKDKSLQEYILAQMIVMMVIRAMEQMNIKQGGFTNQSYKDVTNTNLFSEFKKAIEDNPKVSIGRIEENLKQHRFESSKEQEEYGEYIKRIMDSIKK